MKLNIARLIIGILFVLSTALPSVACPRIGSLLDYNCDQKLKIAFVGDSVVYGRGDSAHANAGGYVFRLAKKLPRAQLTNLGVPGITTGQMLRKLKDSLAAKKGNNFKTKLKDADVIIVDIGRNDYWDDVRSSLAVTNVRRIVSTMNDWYVKNKKIPPYIAVNTLLPLNPTKKRIRELQIPYIKAFNQNLLYAANLKLVKILCRFDTLPKTVISLYDGIHPSSSGYDTITAYIFPRLRFLLATSLGTLRPDTDDDNVYDIAETRLFHTSPTDSDSDDDGFSDGYELFISKTSPTDGAQHP